MNALARVCACQPRLYVSPSCEALPQSFKQTVSSGCPKSRLFWSHPYLRPQLRKPSSPAFPPPTSAARSRRPGPLGPLPPVRPVAGFWAPPLTAGQWSGAGVANVARASTTQRARSSWGPYPHGKRTTRYPSWSVTRQIPHATFPRVSPRKARGACRSQVSSPAPWKIVRLVSRRLVS